MVGAAVPTTWYDGNPCFLVITTDSDESFILDLGEPGWVSKYDNLMREPGTWGLVDKQSLRIVLRIRVLAGEQPYYVARHVGVAGSAGGNEIIVYGIGKKRVDGHVDRLWLMPDGSVATGDDVDQLSVAFIHQIGPSNGR